MSKLLSDLIVSLITLATVVGAFLLFAYTILFVDGTIVPGVVAGIFFLVFVFAILNVGAVWRGIYKFLFKEEK